MAKDVRRQKYYMIRISDHGFQLVAILITRNKLQFKTKPTRLLTATGVIFFFSDSFFAANGLKESTFIECQQKCLNQ